MLFATMGQAFIITILVIGHVRTIYATAYNKSLPRIVGGEDAVIEKYPYQISLEKNGKHNCGGSIIAANRILTAAHCMPKTIAAVYTVRAGSTFREKGGSVHRVDKVVYHSTNAKTNAVPVVDLAVLYLKEPIKFDSTRRAIALTSCNDKAKDGETATVTGWGRIKLSSEFSKQLQVVNVPIINHEVCKKAYKGKVIAGQLCAGYYDKGGKDACQGDSGGPLVVRGKLAGITSWGNGCALPKYPGVYVDVAYYRDWIKKYAGV